MKKRKHAKRAVFYVYVYVLTETGMNMPTQELQKCYKNILRAISTDRCRERRYADRHIYSDIYFRMHHFVVKFSKISSPQSQGGINSLTKILQTFLSAISLFLPKTRTVYYHAAERRNSRRNTATWTQFSNLGLLCPPLSTDQGHLDTPDAHVDIIFRAKFCSGRYTVSHKHTLATQS